MWAASCSVTQGPQVESIDAAQKDWELTAVFYNGKVNIPSVLMDKKPDPVNMAN